LRLRWQHVRCTQDSCRPYRAAQLGSPGPQAAIHEPQQKYTWTIRCYRDRLGPRRGSGLSVAVAFFAVPSVDTDRPGPQRNPCACALATVFSALSLQSKRRGIGPDNEVRSDEQCNRVNGYGAGNAWTTWLSGLWHSGFAQALIQPLAQVKICRTLRIRERFPLSDRPGLRAANKEVAL
jgi:hypothetical protein